MNESQKYTFSYLDDSNTKAIISLKQNVLGGNDALEFGNTIAEIIGTNPESITIDLSLVDSMNSSGLGMLIGALTMTKKANISLELKSVPSKVMGLLELTHLNTVFTISN
jgi:anti-sigma B factor antagonist